MTEGDWSDRKSSFEISILGPSGGEERRRKEKKGE
jgi:hypothetical protein